MQEARHLCEYTHTTNIGKWTRNTLRDNVSVGLSSFISHMDCTVIQVHTYSYHSSIDLYFVHKLSKFIKQFTEAIT